MPRRNISCRLYDLSLSATAKLILAGCQKIDTKTEPFTQYNKLKGEKFIFIDSLWMAGWDEKCVYLMKD